MKYRILHVIDSLDIGGTERQTLLNLSALDRSLFENYLCYLHPRFSLKEEVRDLGIRVFCLDIKGKGDWPLGIFRLRKFIKANKINLVHTNLADSDVIGGIAAKSAGIPVISTWTSPSKAAKGYSGELQVNGKKLRLARFLRRTVYHTCHRHFVAVSEQVAASYIESIGESRARITVIPRGISQSFLRTEPSPPIDEACHRLSLNGAYPILLNVGRLTPQKGQKYLIGAMPLVLETLPEAKLIIAGEGPLREELEKIKEGLGLGGAVSFLGACSEIKTLHLASDIFVFPSLSEGMPGALLEAAALTKPCIASDIDPVQEILENEKTGLLVPPRDSEALARAIIRLGSNKQEAEAFGRRAREVVFARFLIDNTIKQLEALYTKILNA